MVNIKIKKATKMSEKTRTSYGRNDPEAKLPLGETTHLLTMGEMWQNDSKAKPLRFRRKLTIIHPVLSSCSIFCDDTGYPHDGRADKNSYPHDSRADKDSYPHDGRADKDSYPHDRHNQYIMLSL